MISGNPSSKWQRVWLQIRPAFDTSICTELNGFPNGVCRRLLVLPGAGAGNFVRKTSSLQGSGRGVHYFPGGPLANFYGNLYNLNVVFQGDEGPDPLPSFGSPHASTLKLSSHTYWRLQLGKVKNTTFLVKRKFLFLTNNLRSFDETDVRTSQKTTYAQSKIYRTNFIDEIGPWGQFHQ